MKTLLCVGEGLGNVIETLPLANVLRYNNIDFDVLNLSNVENKSVEWIYKNYANVVKTLNTSLYDNRIELATTKGNLRTSDRIEIPLLNDPIEQNIYKPDVNEIEVYLKIAHSLGLSFPKLVYDIDLPKCFEVEHFDFVIHNGCSLQNTSEWQRKKYPHMNELITYLEKKGYTVASIGASAEYCGGHRATGLDLPSSAAYINGCKFFISNDTGTYHLAAGMQKQGIVLFTATSTIKNYHPAFHRTLEVVTTEIGCQPCQYTEAWHKCGQTTYNNWECRNIPVEKIIEVIKNAKVF